MRILMVSQMVPYLPCRDGFRIIPAHLLTELSRRHEVHLVALADGTETKDQLDWANPFCGSLTLLDGEGELSLTRRHSNAPTTGIERVLVDKIRKLDPDIVHVEGAGLAAVARHVPAPIFRLLSAHDSLALRYRMFASFDSSLQGKARFLALAVAAKRFQRRWFREFDQIVVTSKEDKVSLERDIGDLDIGVVPNGVDLEFFSYKSKEPLESGPPRLVFSGRMSWPPNEDAAVWFASEVLPRVRECVEAVEFVVVGAEPTPRVKALARLPGVIVTGTVADIRPPIWEASLYVCPLRYGAGVKNKVLEAMALGTPIVATTQSLTGLEVRNNENIMIANGASEFVEQIVGLLRDSRLRGALSRAGRELVTKRYSWPAVASRFEGYYRAPVASLTTVGE